MINQGAFVAQRLGRLTINQAGVGSIPGLGVIRAPRSTQPSIPRGHVNRVEQPYSLGLRRGVPAYAGLQVKLCVTLLR